MEREYPEERPLTRREQRDVMKARERLVIDFTARNGRAPKTQEEHVGLSVKAFKRVVKP